MPGVVNNYVTIYDCYKEKKCHTEDRAPPFPTFFPQDVTEPLPEDLYAEDLHNFSEQSITFEDEQEQAKS